MNKIYLNYINHLRGAVIIFVVFSHCDSFGITFINENKTFLAKIILSIVHNSTACFIFISGFILHYVYSEKFQIKNFLIKKIKYVILPFLVFSSLDIWYYIIRLIFSAIFHFNNYNLYFNKLKSTDLVKIYLLGHSEINMSLWYIPLTMLIFLLSNIFLKFITMNLRFQLWLIIILMLLSSLIHRRYDENVSALFHNLLYFTPIYLLGIFVSKNIKILFSKLNGKELYLLLILIAIEIFQAQRAIPENINEFDNISFRNIDLILIQKSLLSIFLTIYFIKFENIKLRLLNIFAKNSFGIFFIHGIYIYLYNVLILKFEIKYMSDSVIIFILTSSVVLAISLFSTILIKKILSNTSKYIIGC